MIEEKFRNIQEILVKPKHKSSTKLDDPILIKQL